MTHTEATKQKIAGARLGVPHTEETKQKISEALKAYHQSRAEDYEIEHTDDHRRKLSEAMKAYWRRRKATDE